MLDKFLNSRQQADLNLELLTRKMKSSDLISLLKKEQLIHKGAAFMCGIFGFLGADRRLLGYKKIGWLKFAISAILAISVVVLMGVTMGRVGNQLIQDFHGSNAVAISYDYTFKVMGAPFMYSFYTVICISIANLLFLIIDAIWCYKKILSQNYDKILMSIK